MISTQLILLLEKPNREEVLGFYDFVVLPRIGEHYSIAGIVANAILIWTSGLRYPMRASTRSATDGESRCKENEMNGSRYYGVRVEGAKFGVGFGSALAITISYSENHFDPVGNHRWNFELALCDLFRAFSRVTPLSPLIVRQLKLARE
jgi:hypothetical protein